MRLQVKYKKLKDDILITADKISETIFRDLVCFMVRYGLFAYLPK